jgi:hypothetical protein
VGFDTASLAEGLARVLGDETQRQRMGLRAARDVQRFEYTRTVANYALGLRALVEKARA